MDDKNLAIYNLLNSNGRKTLSELAEKLSMSSPSIKERLAKMLGKKDISIKALLNVRKDNYKTAVCNIKTSSMEEALKIIDKFRECPRVIYMSTLSGRYNLLMIFIAQNATILESTIEKDIKAIPSIVELNISMGEAPVLPDFLDIRLSHDRDCTPCDSKRCTECYLYDDRCDGCPATVFWKKR